MNFLNNYSWTIYLIILLLSFVLGFSNYFDLESSYKITEVEKLDSFLLFRKVLTTNFLMGIYILISFLSFNIFTVGLLSINGIYIGQIYKYLIFNIGIKKTLILLFTHGFIEVIWIILLAHISTKLLIQMLKMLNNDFKTLKSFVKIFYSKQTITAFFLIFISSLIESYITIKFL